MSRHRTTSVAVLASVFAVVLPATAHAAVPRLVFPVVAAVSYTDDFGAPRWQGAHEGNDIMAARKSKVVAVESGHVTKWRRSASAGCMLYLHGKSGTEYMYVHLNNDRTRRNDTHSNRTCRNGIAYAPGLRNGQGVRAGQLIGYVGDSGDADGISPHLHFELHPNGRRAVSPYKRLRAAWRSLFARPPAAVDTLQAKVYGRVLATNTDADPDRVRIRARSVRISNGWWVRPARVVTFSVPSEATVSRRGQDAGLTATTISSARRGDRVIVWTTTFRQTLAAARARAGALAARSIQLG